MSALIFFCFTLTAALKDFPNIGDYEDFYTFRTVRETLFDCQLAQQLLIEERHSDPTFSHRAGMCR